MIGSFLTDIIIDYCKEKEQKCSFSLSPGGFDEPGKDSPIVIR